MITRQYGVSTMPDILGDYRAFFREFRRTYRTTGAIAPSSRFLARSIASELHDGSGPARVLEVGPGTGALTREIIRRLGPQHTFDIVELNARFVSVLQERFQRDADFARIADRTRIFHMPVQELPGERSYDFIISGLPLNNFATELVRSVFESFNRLAAPGGVLSFFEYLWVRDLKRFMASGAERRRLVRVGSVLNQYLARFEFRRSTVWGNFPPALVHHLRLRV
jgi:phospholipid N-methyltransferase